MTELITCKLEINATKTRTETIDGVEYLVVPCVAVKEMVLNSFLLPASEIERSVQMGAWNGVPVPVTHPRNADGHPISARSKENMLKKSAGLFFDARVDAADEYKLRGDIWIDLERAYSRGPDIERAVSQLRNGHSAEVSTGFCANIDATSGTFAGVDYLGIFRDISPDHVAILLDEIGACSQEDGCGCPRVNEKTTVSSEPAQSMTTSLLRSQSKHDITTETKENSMNREQMIEALIACDCCALGQEALDALPDETIEAMHAMSTSFGEKRSELESKLKANEEDEEEESLESQESDDGDDSDDSDTSDTSNDQESVVSENARALGEVIKEFGGIEQFTNTLQAFARSQQDERALLVTKIVANSTLTKEMLEGMDVDALVALDASLTPANYSGRKLQQNQQGTKETVLAMPSLNDK